MRYECGSLRRRRAKSAHCRDRFGRGTCMLLRSAGVCVVMLLPATLAIAQDVPGIEICTVEKTMERRTSCLQSNVDFLQKTIGKLTLDHQQKLDAANRQIDASKVTLVGLQKTIGDLQAAQTKIADDLKKKQDAPPPKDAK